MADNGSLGRASTGRIWTAPARVRDADYAAKWIDHLLQQGFAAFPTINHRPSGAVLRTHFEADFCNTGTPAFRLMLQNLPFVKPVTRQLRPVLRSRHAGNDPCRDRSPSAPCHCSHFGAKVHSDSGYRFHLVGRGSRHLAPSIEVAGRGRTCSYRSHVEPPMGSVLSVHFGGARTNNAWQLGRLSGLVPAAYWSRPVVDRGTLSCEDENANDLRSVIRAYSFRPASGWSQCFTKNRL